MKYLLPLLLLLLGGPALADGPSSRPIERMLMRAEAIRQPPMPLPPRSYQWDQDGLLYSNEDKRFARLPVPAGYRRFGGGLARAWNGAPANFRTPGIGTPATITTLMSRGGGHGTSDTDGDGKGASCERGNASFCPPNPPTPEPPAPEPPAPPTPENPSTPVPPDDGTDVPGPLGLGALAAAFAFSRKLRRRIRP